MGLQLGAAAWVTPLYPPIDPTHHEDPLARRDLTANTKPAHQATPSPPQPAARLGLCLLISNNQLCLKAARGGSREGSPGEEWEQTRGGVGMHPSAHYMVIL